MSYPAVICCQARKHRKRSAFRNLPVYPSVRAAFLDGLRHETLFCTPSYQVMIQRWSPTDEATFLVGMLSQMVDLPLVLLRLVVDYATFKKKKRPVS